MKRILTLTFFLFHNLCIASSLQQPLDSYINRVDRNINLGMSVIDLDTGEMLFKRQVNQVFVPASNMKLFSEAAALIALGPEYRFRNQLSTDSHQVENGILKGNLYLHLSGDPSFKQANLSKLLQKLSAWSVHSIQGNVIVESSHQNIDAYAPGIVEKDKSFSYGAPLSPVMLDENRVTVTINPAGHVGELALVECSPRNTSFIIDNQVKTSSNAKGCGIGIHMDHDNHLTVRGCIGAQQGSVQQRLPILNPFRYLQAAIQSQLAAQNIHLEGNITLGQRPQHAFLLGTQLSKPIAQLMADTLKPSDNLYADSLYLHAAEKIHGSPVNWSQARPLIQNFLEKQTGISMRDSFFADGSGLSRQDHLTPLQTVSLLRFLYVHFPLAFEYISALPIAGQDGTLQRRLRKPNQRGFIRAKTGTMTGVSSLSGYLYTANSHTLAFVMFINTRPKTPPSISGRYRSLVDAMCDYLLQSKPDNRHFSPLVNSHSQLSYQQKPTLAEQHRFQLYKWRRLEYALKQILQNHGVTVLFRDNQLVLRSSADHTALISQALKTLSQKYAFSVAVKSQNANPNLSDKPHLLWVKSQPQKVNNEAVWFVREMVFTS